MADTWSDYMKQHGTEEYAAWEAAVKPYTDRIAVLEVARNELSDKLMASNKRCAEAEQERDSALALARQTVGVLETAHDAVVHADFQTLKEGAGAIPPETCPTINQIKDGIHDAEVLASRGWKKYDSIEDFADDVGRALYDLEAQLEHVRRANGDLRDLGKYWHDTAKELWSAEEDALERMNAFLSRPEVVKIGGGE